MTAGIRVSVTQPSAPASMEHMVAIWSFSIFNMNSPVIFAGALTIFCWGLVPVGPMHPGDGVGHSPTGVGV